MSVDEFHDRVTWLQLTGDAESPVGTDGGVVSDAANVVLVVELVVLVELLVVLVELVVVEFGSGGVALATLE